MCLELLSGLLRRCAPRNDNRLTVYHFGFADPSHLPVADSSPHATRDSSSAAQPHSSPYSVSLCLCVSVLKRFGGAISASGIGESLVEYADVYGSREERVRRRARARVVVMPPAVQAESFANLREDVGKIAEELARHGVGFEAEPERYAMETRECSDTPYHLNGVGVRRRTKMLAEDLRGALRAR